MNSVPNKEKVKGGPESLLFPLCSLVFSKALGLYDLFLF